MRRRSCRPSSRSASTPRRRRRACRTPTAGTSCRTGIACEPLMRGAMLSGSTSTASSVTIVNHMIGHAHSRSFSASSLAAIGERDDAGADARELARRGRTSCRDSFAASRRSRWRCTARPGRTRAAPRSRASARAPRRPCASARAPCVARERALRRAPSRRAVAHHRRPSLPSCRGEPLELAAALFVVVEHVVARAGG